jgi:hypothetical protein
MLSFAQSFMKVKANVIRLGNSTNLETYAVTFDVLMFYGKRQTQLVVANR